MHPIVRDDNHTDVNFSLLQAISKMDDITDQQVASRRNLNFHAEAREKCLIKPHPFDPIDSACFYSNPVLSLGKRGVERFSNPAGAIRLHSLLQHD